MLFVAANILLSLKGDVKFADFGVSKELIEPKRFSVVGSPYWYAIIGSVERWTN